MHSRRRYKICTSVILGELERVFELQCINNGFSQVFFENIRYSAMDDLITSSITFLNPKILLRFSFFYEK